MGRPRTTGTSPKFTLRLAPALRARLEVLAKAENRSLGNYIGTVLRAHLVSLVYSVEKPVSYAVRRRRKKGSGRPAPPLPYAGKTG
jgi:hypothetical protein